MFKRKRLLEGLRWILFEIYNVFCFHKWGDWHLPDGHTVMFVRKCGRCGSEQLKVDKMIIGILNAADVKRAEQRIINYKEGRG